MYSIHSIHICNYSWIVNKALNFIEGVEEGFKQNSITSKLVIIISSKGDNQQKSIISQVQIGSILIFNLINLYYSFS